jgi:hypothetical protein
MKDGAMTIEYAAFGIGAFLIAVILIWKLRLLDAKLGQMHAEITELQMLESRRLLIALNAKLSANESNAGLRNTAIKSNGGVVANDDREQAPPPGLDTGTSLAEGRDLSDLTSLVPLVQIERGTGRGAGSDRGPQYENEVARSSLVISTVRSFVWRAFVASRANRKPSVTTPATDTWLIRDRSCDLWVSPLRESAEMVMLCSEDSELSFSSGSYELCSAGRPMISSLPAR